MCRSFLRKAEGRLPPAVEPEPMFWNEGSRAQDMNYTALEATPSRRRRQGQRRLLGRACGDAGGPAPSWTPPSGRIPRRTAGAGSWGSSGRGSWRRPARTISVCDRWATSGACSPTPCSAAARARQSRACGRPAEGRSACGSIGPAPAAVTEADDPAAGGPRAARLEIRTAEVELVPPCRACLPVRRLGQGRRRRAAALGTERPARRNRAWYRKRWTSRPLPLKTGTRIKDRRLDEAAKVQR